MGDREGGREREREEKRERERLKKHGVKYERKSGKYERERNQWWSGN